MASRALAARAGGRSARLSAGGRPVHGGSAVGSPYRLRPPELATGYGVLDVPAAGGTFNLYGPGRDWLIRLPNVALSNQLTLDGRDEARNIVLIGGAITPPPRADFSTMRLLNGSDWCVYARRGFAGVTGGTFRLRAAESSGAWSAPIAWDAAPPAILAALEAAAGTGSVKAVDGPSTPGGPWKIVPSDARLGRVALDTSALTGTAVTTVSTDTYNACYGGLGLKRWRGTTHIEGARIGGPNCDEACDVLCPADEAVLQLAGCHFSAERYDFHADWHHPDGLQAYLGPCELRAERTDFVSYGSQAMIAQPRQTDSPRALEGLRDWWFDHVFLEARANVQRSPAAPAGAPLYMEDDWPSNNNNSAGWLMRMSDVYARRVAADGTETPSSDRLYLNHYPFDPPQSIVGGTGLTLRQAPPGGYFAPTAGVGYVSPGYAGAPVPTGIKRLQGETKLT